MDKQAAKEALAILSFHHGVVVLASLIPLTSGIKTPSIFELPVALPTSSHEEWSVPWGVLNVLNGTQALSYVSREK
jgi:hypothetical protein